MAALDPRIIRVSVEVNGQFHVFEDLDIHVSGGKSTNPLQNTCSVQISNLNKDTRNYLLTETSPFNKSPHPKRFIVEAGRVSTGVSQVYVGDITAAEPTQPPDIGLIMKARTANHKKGHVMARSGAHLQSLKSLAHLVGKDLKMGVKFEATDRQISNYAFSGAALKQVDALGSAGGVDAYVDDDVLVIKDRGVPLSGRVKEVNMETGMIGIPEVDEHGIKVQFLFDANATIGGQLQVTSLLNPALNGAYSIYGLAFELANRRKPFYLSAAARRLKRG